jgi:hypothetical protein
VVIRVIRRDSGQTRKWSDGIVAVIVVGRDSSQMEELSDFLVVKGDSGQTG